MSSRDLVAFESCGGAWPGAASGGGSRHLYAKNEAATILGAILKKIKEELDG